MKHTFFFILAILSFRQVLSQDNPSPRGYKLTQGPAVVHVYRSIAATPGQPDLSVWNQWDFDYYFLDEGTTWEDPASHAKYKRIFIPSATRWVNNGGVWQRDPAPAFGQIVNWVVGDYVDGEDFNTYLWISETDFNAKVPYYERVYGRFMFSGLTAPFKYRPKTAQQPNAVIDGSLNLGAFLGVRFGFPNSKFGVSLGGFGGTSSFTQNASTNTAITDKSTETTSGFQYGYGLVFDWQKKYQVGFVGGYDFSTGKLADTYIYQQKPWYSFSLNFKFLDFGDGDLGTNKTANNQTKNNNKD